MSAAASTNFEQSTSVVATSSNQPMTPTEMRPAAAMYMHFAFPDCAADWGPLQDIHTAAMLGNHVELARLLDKTDASRLHDADAYGARAIHHAALGSSVEAALLLLEHGADVHALTSTRATALHVAAYNGRIAICKLLVLHGADVHAVDADGRNALFDATYEHGRAPACPCTADTPEVQERGRVAAFLRAAMELPAAELPTFVRRSWELHVAETLQAAIEPPRAPKSAGGARPRAPSLHVLRRRLRCYQRYVDAKDYDGSTALHAAALLGRTEASALLLSHGASVCAATNLGETPLHFAAREGHDAIVELLLAHGADAHAESRACRTPLGEALRSDGGSSGSSVTATLESAMATVQAGAKRRRTEPA